MANKKDIIKEALKQVKLVDAGVKNKYGYDSVVKSPSDYKDKISYPCLYLSSMEAPMLTGCDVGCEVTMIVKAKITSHSLNENQDKKSENFNLEIHEIGVVETES